MGQQVFVSLLVDDLAGREDPHHSDRVGTYEATPDEIAQVLALIQRVKQRMTQRLTPPPRHPHAL